MGEKRSDCIQQRGGLTANICSGVESGPLNIFFLEKMCFMYGNQLIKMFLNVNNSYIYISDDDAVNIFAAKPNLGDFEGFWIDYNFVVVFLKNVNLNQWKCLRHRKKSSYCDPGGGRWRFKCVAPNKGFHYW